MLPRLNGIGVIAAQAIADGALEDPMLRIEPGRGRGIGAHRRIRCVRRSDELLSSIEIDGAFDYLLHGNLLLLRERAYTFVRLFVHTKLWACQIRARGRANASRGACGATMR